MLKNLMPFATAKTATPKGKNKDSVSETHGKQAKAKPTTVPGWLGLVEL